MTQRSLSLLDKLKFSYRLQLLKFKRIGNFKFVSLINFILLFTLLPTFLRVIWPYFQNSNNPIVLYLISTAVVNVLVIGLYNIAMYFIYTKKISFFQQYRCQPNKAWMWQQDQQKWKPFFRKTLKIVLINIFIVGPLLTTADSLIRFDLRMMTEECPSTFTIFWQFCLFLMGEEILFYIVHRIAHTPKFYWIHKQHHEYNVTIALALVYASPLQHIFANLIPSGAIHTFFSRVYPVHIFTVIVWFTFRIIESCDGHCGYDWPWALSHLLPFSAGGNYHFFHHSKNVGNYGAILHIFDTLSGTNDEYFAKWDQQNQTKSVKSE